MYRRLNLIAPVFNCWASEGVVADHGLCLRRKFSAVPKLRNTTKLKIRFVAILVALVWTAELLPSQTVAQFDGEQADKGKPNIVLFLADDLGWTGLSCFGSDLYETPNLDRLAAQGTKFTDAYAACTVCSPTRASLLTGMYPARLNLTDFIPGQNRPFAKLSIPDWTKGLSSDQITIAETLKAAGYRTGHIGKWHLDPVEVKADCRPDAQGFDFCFDKQAGVKGYRLPDDGLAESGSNYLTDLLTDKACDFIEESKDDPFFLYFAYHVPHTPIQGRDDHVRYFENRLSESGDDELIHTNPVYAAMVKSLDQSVGRVLKKLEKHGLEDNTMVLFISDNGGLTQRYGRHDEFTENLPLRRGKGSAYEGGVRVPMIVRWPQVTKPGSICSTPVMTIDFFPTLVEASGAYVHAGHEQVIDGQSFVPQLRDPKKRLYRDLFWHFPHYHAGGDGPYSAIRSDNYRLIHFHEDNSVRLYDLEDDIGEKVDLAKYMPKLRKDLSKRLQDWRGKVSAQMPKPNPEFDQARQTEVARNKNRKR